MMTNPTSTIPNLVFPLAASAPQPTEDSSSSPADGATNNCRGAGAADAMLSDSDDRQELKLSLNARQSCMFGNFESDSLNETTFSPARPNARRKRKFKRMAVEYETTPSTPGTTTAGFALHTGAFGRTDGLTAATLVTVNPVVSAPFDSGASTSAFASVVASTSTSIAPVLRSDAVAIAAAPDVAASSASMQALQIGSAATAATASAGPSTSPYHQPHQLPHLPATAAIVLKKRPLKLSRCGGGGAGGDSENFRANLFFCGKRKRSHRDRYYEQHSSSVPRQRADHLYQPKYSEYRCRNRSFSSAVPRGSGERIMPLHTSIVSKIERISQDSRSRQSAAFRFSEASTSAAAAAASAASTIFQLNALQIGGNSSSAAASASATATAAVVAHGGIFGAHGTAQADLPAHRIGFNAIESVGGSGGGGGRNIGASSTSGHLMHKPTTFGGLSNLQLQLAGAGAVPSQFAAELHHNKQLHKEHHPHSQARRQQRRTRRLRRLQFDDPNAMEALHMPDMVSSSSMSSSSDSEAAQRNDTDREGDDELTDWPGNEAMVNFASKNDFKRAKPVRSQPAKLSTALPFIRSEEPTGDDDTLMSADEMFAGACGGGGSGVAATAPPSTLNLISKYGPSTSAGLSQPIAIQSNARGEQMHPQLVESEMSGETSNNFLSSPGGGGAVDGSGGFGGIGGGVGAVGMGGGAGSSAFEVREIRAGCRRIRNERPGFTILTSVNEDLSK